MGVDSETEMTLNVVARKEIRNISIPDDDECDSLPFNKETMKQLLYRLPFCSSREDMESKLEILMEKFYVHLNEKRSGNPEVPLEKEHPEPRESDLDDAIVVSKSKPQCEIIHTEQLAEKIKVGSKSDLALSVLSTNTSDRQSSMGTLPLEKEERNLLDKNISKEKSSENEAQISSPAKDKRIFSPAEIKMQAKQSAQYLWDRMFKRKQILEYGLEKLIPDTLAEFKWTGSCNPKKDYVSEWNLRWDCVEDNDQDWIDVEGKLKGGILKKFNETRRCVGREIEGYTHEVEDSEVVDVKAVGMPNTESAQPT